MRVGRIHASRDQLADHARTVDVTRICRQDRGIKSFGFCQPPGPLLVKRMPIQTRVVDPYSQRGKFRGEKSARLRCFKDGARIAGITCQQQFPRKKASAGFAANPPSAPRSGLACRTTNVPSA